MNCPICAAGDHRVVQTTQQPDGSTRRARDCIACGHRWFTVEASEAIYRKAADIAQAFETMRAVVGE